MSYSPDTISSSLTFRLSLSYKRRARFSGWRGGFVLAIIGSSLVLLFNIICAIIAAAIGGPHDGIATIYTGNCLVASRLTTGLQLHINILSSSLLGASSYCLQQLGAPTRKEIDRAHGKGKSLDVGVLSLRNLPNISKRRQVAWLLLAMSSIPLHFLYNSVIFQTIATNEIDLVFVHEAFLTTKGGWKLEDGNEDYMSHFQALQNTVLDEQYANTSRFENISTAECFHRYQTPFMSAGNGFAVMPMNPSDANDNSSLVDFAITDAGISIGKRFLTYVLYCLSEISPERCQVQLSQTILFIVIACNTLKVTLMFTVLRWMDDETIVTTGDAIQSFILNPDTTTTSCCLIDRNSFQQTSEKPEARQIQRYQPGNRHPWYKVISRKRWLSSLVSYSLVLATALYLYSRVGSRKKTCVDPDVRKVNTCRWNNFGNVDPSWILGVYLGSTSIIPYVLLANTPQVVASFLYLSYNSLFTAMLANREWSSYAHKRTTLRVTLPTSSQRSSYFLSLPYRYSLPLIAASILLHWFISQTLFIAPIAVYKNGILEPTSHDWFIQGGSGTYLGFSDSALVAAIVMGCLMVVVCLAFAGFCRYPMGMPLGGTDSAVISAACHVKHRDGRKARGLDAIVERPLQWGVTIEGTKDRAGHCSFSDKAVQQPVEGCLYA